jgi:hypothetical protein
VGVAGKALTVVGGAYSAYSLYNDYQRGDVAAGIGDAAGVVSSAATLGAGVVGSTVLASGGAVTGAFAVGYAVGTEINEHLISEETKDAIGGTIDEIMNKDGWKEIFKHPFGFGI